jgi:hypothetical protein
MSWQLASSFYLDFTMKIKILKIVEISDERKDIYFDDDLIITVTHDEHGWAGMEAVETTARKIAQHCGAGIAVQYGDDLPTDTDDEEMLTTLRGYFPDASEDTLLNASELLCDFDIEAGIVSEHIDLAISIANQHGLSVISNLLYVKVPGEFEGVTAELLASSSADKTYELNHELAEMELGIKRAGVVFDVVFSVKR